MDSSVSLEDRIWFLRVCHHIPFSLYSQTGERCQYNMTHALFMPNNQGKNRHTREMFNTYCSTTVTMVTRTCLIVTLYVHTLPGLFLTAVLYGLAQKSSPIPKIVVGKYEF